MRGPNPVGGFAPTLRHDGLGQKRGPSCSASPCLPKSELLDVYRIERQDYVAPVQGERDYSDEPPSSTDKPLARHPALPAKHVADGNSRPLSLVGGQVYRVCFPDERPTITFVSSTTRRTYPCPAMGNDTARCSSDHAFSRGVVFRPMTIRSFDPPVLR